MPIGPTNSSHTHIFSRYVASFSSRINCTANTLALSLLGRTSNPFFSVSLLLGIPTASLNTASSTNRKSKHRIITNSTYQQQSFNQLKKKNRSINEKPYSIPPTNHDQDHDPSIHQSVVATYSARPFNSCHCCANDHYLVD